MATKPNIAESRWGVDGSNADAANVTAPTSGQRDTGYLLNSVPSSAVDNYLRVRAYRWFQYLDAGALVGSHSIDGALTVGGQPLTFSSTFTANSSTSVFTTPSSHGRSSGDGPLRVSVSGGTLAAGLVAGTDYWFIFLTSTTYQLATSFANAVAGIGLTITTAGTGTQTIASTGSTTHATDAVVSRNLAVGGGVTLGSLTVSGASALAAVTASGTITANGAVTANGLVTANAGLTAGANQAVTVSGTGRYRHGTRTIGVPIVPAQVSVSPLIQLKATVSGTGSGSNVLYAPFALEAGKRITAIRARVQDSTTGPTKVQVQLFSMSNGSETFTTLATSSPSAGDGTEQDIQATGLAINVAAGTRYFLAVFTQTGSAACSVFGAEVDYIDP